MGAKFSSIFTTLEYSRVCAESVLSMHWITGPLAVLS